MPITPIPLLKGDTRGIEADWRDALPVNMYPVLKPLLGAQGYMHPYPGLSEFATGSGIDRGGFYNDRQGNHFRVSGKKFISVSSTGVVTDLGAISGTDQAAMPYSFNTQAVIADGNYYLYDPSGGFRQVTDPDLGNPIDAVWADGVYFFTDGESLYHTELNDEESIEPLDFGSAEFMPDGILGVAKTQDNKVMVFGRYTLEYFVFNTNATDFLFTRVETRAQKIGIVATHAKTAAGDDWYVVGNRRDESLAVHAISIGAARKVSTREIDKILEKYTEPELADIRVETRIEKDSTFILVHLPNECLSYNITIDAWSILETGIRKAATPHRSINGVRDQRTNKWYYGDKQDSRIGELDNTRFTQYDDEPQGWELYSPFLRLETQSLNSIEIDTLPGDGVSDEDDATVFLSLTYDGKTYGTETIMDYGSRYDYDKRFIKRLLGYVREWVGFKYRGATRSRMSFGLFRLDHG